MMTPKAQDAPAPKRLGRPPRTKRTPKKDSVATAKAAIIAKLSSGASIAAAASSAGIGRTTAYKWRNEDAAFAAQWDDAIEAGSDILEDEATRRALHGTARPVAVGGQIAYVVQHSDTLLIFLLKARRPERYRDNVRIRAAATVDAACLADARSKLADRLAAFERASRAPDSQPNQGG